MNTKCALLLVSAFVLAIPTLTPVQAQQHRATLLGNPETRFADPLRTPDDLRRMFASAALRADVDFIARESGYQGDLNDLRRAAASAKILELRIPTGTLLPAMSTRKQGKPVLLREVLWAGQGPIEVYEFYFASQGRRYRVVTPKPCANFWVEDYGKELRPVLAMKCSAPAEVPLRRPTEVCLTVSNTGDAPESATTLTLSIPGSASLLSATGGGKAIEGRVQWDIANLSPGSSSNVCAVFRPAHPETLSFIATANGRVSPPADTQCETRVVGVAAVLLEVVDLDDPIEVGKNQTYEVRVVNQGSAALTNVKVVCLLEEGQEFVSGTGASVVEATDRRITFATLPELSPKDRAMWQVVVKALKAGDVRFTTELMADQFQELIKETEATQQH